MPKEQTSGRRRDKLTIRPGKVGEELLEMAGSEQAYRELTKRLLQDGATLLKKYQAETLLEAVLAMGVSAPVRQPPPQNRDPVQMEVPSVEVEQSFADWC